MDKDFLISKLPVYQGKKVLIKRNQSVSDIMEETLDAHDFFAGDYDKIAYFFTASDDRGTLERLFNFLKLNVRYKEESERVQQTKSPAAILETGVCDCKCYALFIGGVLDALNRRGARFNWNYAFASYNNQVKVPGHVFIQCVSDGNEYWVDPVLSSFDTRDPRPAHIIVKKKIADMALYRVGAVHKSYPVPVVLPRAKANPAVGSVGDFVTQYPVVSLAAVIAVVYLVSRKKRR